MPYANVDQLKELRRRTEAGVGRCRAALEASGGNLDQAVEYLRQESEAQAERRAAREAGEGLVGNYLHHTGKLAALVEVSCETDFVARTEVFQRLVKRLAEHVAAAAPQFVDRDAVPATLNDVTRAGFYGEAVLLEQPWIREPDKTIGDLITEASAALGERIVVRRFARFRVGEP